MQQVRGGVVDRRSMLVWYSEAKRMTSGEVKLSLKILSFKKSFILRCFTERNSNNTSNENLKRKPTEPGKCQNGGGLEESLKIRGDDAKFCFW